MDDRGVSGVRRRSIDRVWVDEDLTCVLGAWCVRGDDTNLMSVGVEEKRRVLCDRAVEQGCHESGVHGEHLA